ncbi:AAA family ATPase [Chitinimonas lacunae]|uniref:AAA family ATPase n=1 Tax=Chitinimonas lacunae TaxID=1963018 RepID=A0ABV8MN98_9NEIS
MKPLHLSLQAFGPFAACETVDFTCLPPDALFLIHGPTGAGKTSLLDGICFALYGETSGSERQGREMRSHHAVSTVATEVEFEFELGDGRYRVRRAPEQEIAGKRGSALVTRPTSAELARWEDGDWRPLAAKSQEVTSQVEALMGFRAEQFRQVVLLPQGQFRKLLSASSREREEILEALFSTAIYKRLQERLQGTATALRHQAEAVLARREELLQQAETGSVESLATRVDEARAALQALDVTLTTCRVDEAAAQKAYAEGEAIMQRFSEAEAARSALVAREADEAVMAAERGRREAAQRALTVVPADRGWEEAVRWLSGRRESLGQAQHALGQAEAGFQTAEAAQREQQARVPLLRAAEKELSQLESVSAAVSRWREAEQAAQVVREAAERASHEARALQQRQQTAETHVEGLRERAGALAPAATQVELLTLRLARLSEQEQHLRRLSAALAQADSASQAVAEAAKAGEAAQQRRDAAVEALQRADTVWRHGQAAVLARHLLAGSPCPVCGGLEHPAPAHSEAATLPTEAELEALRLAEQTAQQTLDSARNAEQHARQTQAANAATLAALRAGLAGDEVGLVESAADCQSALASHAAARLEAERALGVAREDVRTLETIQKSLQEAEGTVATTRLAAQQGEAVAQQAQMELAGALKSAQERREVVPADLQEADALLRALAEVRQRIERMRHEAEQAQRQQQEASVRQAAARAGLEAAEREVAEGEQRQSQTLHELTAALAAAGFAGRADYLAARLDPHDYAALERTLSAHDQALAAARERLARAEGALSGVTAPDLAALEKAWHDLREQADELLRQREALRQRLEADQRLIRQLEQIGRELGDLDQRYRVAGHLAQVARGDNSRKMAFQRYVLAALLDDVLRQASLRLRAMSRGRYTLQRREEVVDARRHSGLDLEVFDDYTGRLRPASTLSGGEGFMAALSLALGLSDVVQSYAGGIRLDTLFIDEGFGHLDQESLDMALKALIDLRRQGRMVGIISHVEELKRQIDIGIEIVAGVAGSRIRVGSAG